MKRLWEKRRNALAVARYLKWRGLAVVGYDPHDIYRHVSLREGVRVHWEAELPS